jgi:hypothetical protein
MYTYIGLYKSNEAQQLRALPRQRLFLGEGPWAHVPVEHEMSGDGVGKNFDGSNGVIVDSDPWTKEAHIFSTVCSTVISPWCIQHVYWVYIAHILRSSDFTSDKYTS